MIIWIVHKIYSRQRELKLLNASFYRFCSEEISEIVWFLECLQQGFVWSFISWVFKLASVNCVYEITKFSPQIQVKYFKNIAEFTFSLFLIINYVENSCSKSSTKENEEKVHSKEINKSSLKGILKNIKIKTKLFHVRHESFCKCLAIHTFTFRDRRASRVFAKAKYSVVCEDLPMCSEFILPTRFHW